MEEGQPAANRLGHVTGVTGVTANRSGYDWLAGASVRAVDAATPKVGEPEAAEPLQSRYRAVTEAAEPLGCRAPMERTWRGARAWAKLEDGQLERTGKAEVEAAEAEAAEAEAAEAEAAEAEAAEAEAALSATPTMELLPSLPPARAGV